MNPVSLGQTSLAALVATLSTGAFSQEVDAGASRAVEVTVPAPPQTTPALTPSSNPNVRIGGYAEMYYQWNLNRPVQGITNYRGFDNRHNAFTISNAALDLNWDNQRLIGKLTLQVGHTPSTYYLAEPTSPGTAGANASDAALWKYIQQAYAGYRFGTSSPIVVTAGIFLSPIGPESMAVKDNWNWSRSNLFFGLPFYHTGVKVSTDPTQRWSANAAVYNGWNSVVDNNSAKSIAAQLLYTHPRVTWSLLYFGGNERAKGSAEGSPWRHLVDSHVTWTATDKLSLLAHANAGIESNVFGTSRWAAGALYGRYQLTQVLYVAARADIFHEHAAQSTSGTASPIFWPAKLLASATATLDYRPSDSISFRLEYRRDQSDSPLYFNQAAFFDGTTQSFIPNKKSQDTFTVGLASWF